MYKKFDNQAIKDLSILYLEFAKAFDTVPDNFLIQKLYNIGVVGKLIQLISLYLTNRKQYVKSNSLVVLTGDINFTETSWANMSSTKEYKQLILDQL